jgi:hypothetical protein
MSSIKVQINHSESITKKELTNILFEQIGEENNLTFENIYDLFEIVDLNILPNGTFNTIFVFEIPEIEFRDVEPSDIVFSFLSSLGNFNSVLSVVKINDTLLQERASKFYKGIIDIEMDFRNVLTYILNYDNKYITEELFKDFGINKSEKIDFDKIKDKYENGLFYIYFNHYSNFSEPQKIKAEKILDLLQNPNIVTFQSFKAQIATRAILEERHTSFLFSIKTKLKPLEDMRNAIMHIRNLSKDIVDNYEKVALDSKVGDEIIEKGIKTIIKDFWKEENNVLKESTWFAIAKSQILKIVVQEGEENGLPIYKTNDDKFDYEFNGSYIGLYELKASLIPYLMEIVIVPNFDPTIDATEDLIDSVFPN